MKKYCIILLAILVCGCQQSEDEKAAPLLNKIDSLYKAGDYQSTLNAITKLRANYPKALESRKKALKIWQQSSLKQTQADIAKTDSALQATLKLQKSAKSIGESNELKAKSDSLQIRYDALCNTVRVIHKRQKEF